MRRAIAAAALVLLMPGLGFVGPAPDTFDPVYSDSFDDAATEPHWDEDAGDNGTLVWDIDTTAPGGAYIQGQRYEVAPPTPFRATWEVRDSPDWDLVGGSPGIGGVWLNLAQAAPGPYIGWGTDVGLPGEMHLGSSKFDASGAFLSNPQVLATVHDDSYVTGYIGEMTVLDDDDVSVRMSLDGGATWIQLCTNFDPGVVPNFLGIESGGARSVFEYVLVELL